MKISLNWLRDYVDLPKNLDPQDLADRLTMHVVEVESFEREAGKFEGMVVGKVLSIDKHPNADRLSVCKVDIGKAVGLKLKTEKSGRVQIVCGGKNLKEGMLVAVALSGSRVKWHGEGELVELKETEIRGVKSFGMICAGSEIGLDSMQGEQPIIGDGPQILDISAYKSKPGAPLASALGKDDVVYEISNVSLSNRPDLWSHFGIAIEVGRLYGKAVKTDRLKMKFPNKVWKKSSKELSVTIEAKELCARYVGVLVEGITLKETPMWIRKRLEAIGQRPISTLVDISNYVMFEIGQPIHVFDKSKIQNPKSKIAEIIIRKAKKGEKLVTLDGIDRELDGETLVIADHEKPIAIAGVMGGLDSGVTENTSSIIVECATFDPVSIRKTQARLGLKTDASQRFEKALDPQQPRFAVARVLALIEECQTSPNPSFARRGHRHLPIAKGEHRGGLQVRAVVDAHGAIRDPKPIAIPFSLIERRIGFPVLESKAKKILLGLGFSVKGTAKEWKVTPPSKRATRDIAIPEDIVEEVARHIGYNNIPDSLPSFPIVPPAQSQVLRVERSMKRFLVGSGFHETLHKPFINLVKWQKYELETDDHVVVINPIDPNARYLRQSLLPGLLEDVKDNRSEHATLALFEWGRVFIPIEGAHKVKQDAKERLPAQPLHCSLVWYQEALPEEALRKVKGMIHALLQAAGYRGEVVMAGPAYPYYVHGSGFNILANGVNVGEGGILGDMLTQEISASPRHRIMVCTLDIEALVRETQHEKKFMPLPLHPAIRRDLALVVDEAVQFAAIEKLIRHEGGPLLNEVELFDIFRGGAVTEGKKSLALHLTFRSSDRTLKSEEVAAVMNTISAKLMSTLHAMVRE